MWLCFASYEVGCKLLYSVYLLLENSRVFYLEQDLGGYNLFCIKVPIALDVENLIAEYEIIQISLSNKVQIS